MKKILIVLLCVLMIGCQKIDAPDIETHEIIDGLGRAVQVPVVVDKVGCIYAISGHITALLGEGEKIVSVTSGLKRDVMMMSLVPTLDEATEPKNGGSINIEELLINKPDVIFVAADIASNEAETAKLDKFNIPYLAIAFNSIEEQQEMVRMIGKVYNKSEEAEDYITYCNDKINRIEALTSNVDDRVNVYHSVNEATRTDPKGSIVEEWFDKTGMNLVSTSEELKFISGDYYASLEQILEWNPEVIFVNENGVDNYIMTDSKWQSLNAVHSEKVYMLPVGISRWGHPNSLEIPFAMMFAGKKVYPQLFSEVDIEREMQYFYKTFFDVEVSDQMIDEILNGDGMRIRKDER